MVIPLAIERPLNMAQSSALRISEEFSMNPKKPHFQVPFDVRKVQPKLV